MVWLRGVARQLGSINQQRFPGLIMNRTMFSASKDYSTDFIIVETVAGILGGGGVLCFPHPDRHNRNLCRQNRCACRCSNDR